MNNLITLAYAAGLAGESWGNWTCSDEVQASLDADPSLDFDSKALGEAFEAGERERRVTIDKWVTRWTTAPDAYDTFGTETIETVTATSTMGTWRGDTIRRVLIDPRHLSYQDDRYHSGLHPCWDVDPRVQDETMRARIEFERAEREQTEAKYKAGLAWLATASDAEIEDPTDELTPLRVTYKDLRDERERRRVKAEHDKLTEEWNRCVAIVTEGSTLIDIGSDSVRGQYGVIPGRKPHVWYNVFVRKHWQDPDNAHEAMVTGEGLQFVGSLAYVADWLTTGRLRVAKPGEVPPRAVLERLGHENLKSIHRVSVEGKFCYVGRPLFGEHMVLDENGKIVRSKKVREAALKMFAPIY